VKIITSNVVLKPVADLRVKKPISEK